MKHLLFYPAAVVLLCGVSVAQSSSARVIASPNGRHGITSGPSVAPSVPNGNEGRTVKRAVPPPPSMAVHGAAGKSTAQTMAARQNRPPITSLPAFSVTTLAGQSVRAISLAPSGHWLMLYVAPRCMPCATLLRSLSSGDHPGLKAGKALVIVVRGHAASDLTELRAQYPALGDATWVLDPQGDGMKALKLAALPTTFALESGNISFVLPGLTGDPGRVGTIASSWMINTMHTGSSSAATTAATAKAAALTSPQQ